MSAQARTVAGVDVGGTKKGFHAVVLRGNIITSTLTTYSTAEAVTWCRAQRVSAVGIDAPCRWSLTGRARPCERELVRLGMSCFSTPSQATGEVHPFYRWMVQGAELFRLLTPHYRLYDGRASRLELLSFETFPHAIACALAVRKLVAKSKRTDRRRVLEKAGIVTESLVNIDAIDAALCAVAAQHVLAGRFKAYGDASEGFILLPTCS